MAIAAIACLQFVYPLPRDEGYEFFFSEFSGVCCYFTSLINYQVSNSLSLSLSLSLLQHLSIACWQMYQANAPVCLTLTHYTDLQESKGIYSRLATQSTDP